MFFYFLLKYYSWREGVKYKFIVSMKNMVQFC